jgi:hypothetical protein
MLQRSRNSIQPFRGLNWHYEKITGKEIYRIFRCSPRYICEGGKSYLGYIRSYTDGFRWSDLSGFEDPWGFRSINACMTGFIKSRKWMPTSAVIGDKSRIRKGRREVTGE